MAKIKTHQEHVTPPELLDEYNPLFEETKKNELVIHLPEGGICTLPSEFKELATEIEHSKYILQLKDNWDDEGSTHYEIATWIKAITFICNYSKRISEFSGKVISRPSIYQGPNGSIDIYWDTKNYYLLINIPQEENLPAKFYGSDRNNNNLEGTIDIFSSEKLSLGVMFILENIN